MWCAIVVNTGAGKTFVEIVELGRAPDNQDKT